MSKRIINIIFYLIILFFSIFILFWFKDYSVLNKRIVINDGDSYKKYNGNNYVTLDMSKSTETRFSVKENYKIKSTIYMVKYDDRYLLVELSSNSILTDKVNVIYNSDNNYISSLKEDLVNESKEKTSFYKGYYSNININENEYVIRIKYIINIVIIAISSLMLIINIIGIIIKKK